MASWYARKSMSTAMRQTSSVKIISDSIKNITLLFRGCVDYSNDSDSTKLKIHPVTQSYTIVSYLVMLYKSESIIYI